MTEITNQIQLDAARLEFEKKKWQDESEFRRVEQANKQKEVSPLAKLIPILGTIAAAIVTLAGTAVGSWMQGNAALDLETRKFLSTSELETRKQQHELVLKMISVDTEEQARKNIVFLAESGLLKDEEIVKKLLAAKGSGLLPPDNRPQRRVQSSSDINLTVSDAALALIIEFEFGGATEKLEVTGVKPYMADPNGGIMIGFFYDMSRAKPDTFRTDWSKYLSEGDLQTLSQVVGLRGPAAKAQMGKISETSVPWSAAVSQFVNEQVPQIVYQLQSNLENLDQLPPDSVGALISLAYNRGFGFRTAGDRFAEMRNIAALMQEMKFAEVPAQIRAMKRLPTPELIKARREKEAALFEKGLQP